MFYASRPKRANPLGLNGSPRMTKSKDLHREIKSNSNNLPAAEEASNYQGNEDRDSADDEPASELSRRTFEEEKSLQEVREERMYDFISNQKPTIEVDQKFGPSWVKRENLAKLLEQEKLDLRAERTEFHRQLEEKNGIIKGLQRNLDKVSKILRAEKEKNKKLLLKEQEEMKQLNPPASIDHTKHKLLEEKLEAMEKNLNHKTKEISLMKSKLERSEQKSRALGNELQTIRQNAKDSFIKQEQLEKLVQQLEKSRDDQILEIQQLNEKHTRILETAKEDQEKTVSSTEKAFQAKIFKLENENMKLLGELMQVKSQVIEMRKQHLANNNLRTNKEEFEGNDGNVNAIQQLSMMNNLEDKLNKMSLEHEDLSKMYQRVSEKNRDLIGENQRMKLELERSNIQQKKVQALLEMKESLPSKVEPLEKEIAGLKSQLKIRDDANLFKERQFQVEKESLRRTIDHLENQLESNSGGQKKWESYGRHICQKAEFLIQLEEQAKGSMMCIICNDICKSTPILCTRCGNNFCKACNNDVGDNCVMCKQDGLILNHRLKERISKHETVMQTLLDLVSQGKHLGL